jgi:hypothetical protein
MVIIQFTLALLSSVGVLSIVIRHPIARAMITASWIELLNGIFKKRAEDIVALELRHKQLVADVDLIDERITLVEHKVVELDQQTAFTLRQYEEANAALKNQFRNINKRMDASDEMNKTQMKMIDRVIDLVKEN